MATAPTPTKVRLLAPRKAGDRGDNGRWMLHLSWAQGGRYVALQGPRADQVEQAKVLAADHLGYSPEWVEVPSLFPNWPLCLEATPPKAKAPRKRK